MSPYSLRPRPKLTSHIQFRPAPPPPFPTLTARTEFVAEALVAKRAREEYIDEDTERIKRRRQRSLSSTGLGGLDSQTTQGRSHNPPSSPNRSATPLPSGTRRPDSGAQPQLTRASDNDTHQSPQHQSHNMTAGPPPRFPKPTGEPGRPGSGGFCLEDVLMETGQWTKASFSEFNDIVKTKVDESTLDVTASFAKQNRSKIEGICSAVQKELPHLAQYEKCWPVLSALKLVLKSRAESARRAQSKAEVERIAAAVRRNR